MGGGCWSRGIYVGLIFVREGVENMSVGFCDCRRVKVDIEVWMSMDLLEGEEGWFEAV